MTAREVTNGDDIIDVRDVIARLEEVESYKETSPDQFSDGDEEELANLVAFLEQMKGRGGDEQWRGDWYPITAIRDDYFETYAQDLAEDIGAINREVSWPYTCIDWERAARDLQMDYTSVEFDGVTYWVR